MTIRPGRRRSPSWSRRCVSAGGLDDHVAPVVLSSGIPNALALPGGKVLLFSALLAAANDPDEIAAVIAHEFGHVAHRDNIKVLIHNGGTSFLIGLLFGDLSGSGALVFASQTLITSSYSREAERDADTFSIEVMQKLGRSPKGLGELLFRITGKEQGGSGPRCRVRAIRSPRTAAIGCGASTARPAARRCSQGRSERKRCGRSASAVGSNDPSWPGFVPAIHVFATARRLDVDASSVALFAAAIAAAC
ncbi:MAG: M48 family metallopeptidase [Rhodopseudomonas palustris]|nr:M48 family metallopeptidase [Rhodopseudomonas palustris]